MSEVGREAEREAELLTHATRAYAVTRGSVWVWLHLVHRMRVEGREHVPADGPVMLVSNHASFLDIPLVAASLRRHVAFVARDSLAKFRPLGWLMRRCGAVLVERGASDRRALREIQRHLELGDAVSIFPEGTRTRDGSLGEFRRGALLGARQTGARLVPTALRGTFAAWPRHRAFPLPHRVSIRFGEPIDPSDPDALERARERIGAMLAG